MATRGKVRKGAQEPGWVTPRAMAEGIRAQLVPAALALGWVPREAKIVRRGNRQFNGFEFERLSPDRIERMGFDFQHGSRPDVWICFAVWSGEGGVCTRFVSGDCSDELWLLEPWRWFLRKLQGKLTAEERIAKALEKGSKLLQIHERYLRDGVKHRHLSTLSTVPPHRWPEGYEQRMTKASVTGALEV